MFNTFKNLGRKPDKHGDLHLISFLGVVLSRLAYLNDNKFLASYNAIMGPVFHPRILQGINSVTSTNLATLLDDQKIFGLDNSPNNIFRNHEYQFNGKKFIDFTKLNMPQNINIINGDIAGNQSYPVPGQQTPMDSVKYISIGWSNYGEIYVVADKRIPNTLFLIFRGTYSAKTAALYSKPTSIVPLTVCKDAAGKPEQFLYGIFKATSEMIHTIVEAMRYLATVFLGASQPNSVKIFTTGHSLGGAMCTDFAYLWMGIKKTAPYNAAPYNVLADNIICISVGAPRCMSSSVAAKFCKLVALGKILYLRITTRGDPVTSLPPKTGFQHPCSEDENMRKKISEDCNETLVMRPRPNINYAGNLDCQNYKTRAYIPNMLSHTVYLNILFTKAVDIVNFLKGIGMEREVLRGPGGSTVCRLVMGQNANYKAIFFDVNKAREKPNNTDAVEEKALAGVSKVSVGGVGFSMPKFTAPKFTMPKIGGSVAQDVRMTSSAFNLLIQQMIQITGDLCPQKGKMFDPFNNQIMPDLSCPGLKINVGGTLTRKLNTRKLNTRKLNTRKYKNNKSKKNKSRKNR
jgi:hypothetical protein